MIAEDTKDDEERLQSASQLPQTIHQRKEALAEQQRALAQSRAQVLDLVHRINDVSMYAAPLDSITMHPHSNNRR